MSKTKVIAHRGSKGTHPENTLPAFLHAVKIGADGIELDVQLAKDGEVVVFHDEKIQRTTDGKGYIPQLSLDELKKLDAGSWFSLSYAGTRIPTLMEVMEALEEASFQGVLNIELKTDQFAYEGIEEKVLEETQSSDWSFSVVFSSFNEQTLIRLSKLDPEAELAFLFKKRGEERQHLLNGAALSAWHPKWDWVQQVPETLLKQQPIRVWTVNKDAEMMECFRMSLEAVITDFPEKALEIRERMK